MTDTIAVELWGGPFDGETVNAFPAPAVVTVFHDPVTKRDELSPLQTPTYYDRWAVLGCYVWLEPARLTWRPGRVT